MIQTLVVTFDAVFAALSRLTRAEDGDERQRHCGRSQPLDGSVGRVLDL